MCILDSNKSTGSEIALFSRELSNVCEYQLTKLGEDLCKLKGAETMTISLAGYIMNLCIDF